jgi:hypothetical protein
MIPCTVSYGPLRIDWDRNGTLTLARTDIGGNVQLSLSEWEFLLRCAALRGWPISHPVPVSADSPASPDTPR